MPGLLLCIKGIKCVKGGRALSVLQQFICCVFLLTGHIIIQVYCKTIVRRQRNIAISKAVLE